MVDAASQADGPVLAGRYRLARELGAGGFGSVWEAVDQKSGERVALKELRRMDAASLYRFKQEFRSLAGMTHPNLVGLRELHGAGELWFFTMNLVRGSDFLSYVRATSGPSFAGAGWLGRSSDVTVDAGSLPVRGARASDTIDVSSRPATAGW